MNIDALQAFFDRMLVPLGESAQAGAVRNCIDRIMRLCFPILPAWIADSDHEEHPTFHGISNESCP